MSKFKAGDKVYALGYPHRDWEYEILMVDLKSATGEDAILVRAIKVPKMAVVSIGYASLLNEDKVAKLPTVVRSAPMWHVYYLDVHGGVQISLQNASNFKTEEDVRKYISCYRGMSVLEITKVEREFEIE